MSFLTRMFPKKKQFVLTIGDEGAILTYIEGRALKDRLFARLDSQESIQAFEKLLASSPKVPINIVLDLMELSCVQQSLPAVSALSIGKLVKRRLERDYPADDIKGVIQLGRSKAGRKDWNYMFMTAHMVSPLTDWLELVIRQQNVISGIFMLPAEGANLVHEITKAFKDKPAERWQCLVLHNKVSGFRQIVLKDGKVIFTRLIASAPHDLPGVTAGNIEQEIVNTIEYLHRLSFSDKDKIDIFIGVSQPVKSSFEVKEIKGYPITVLTPYDISETLNLPHAAKPQDQFMDVVFAANFAQHKPVLTLHSPKTEKIIMLTTANAFAKVFAVALLPLIVVYIAYTVVRVNSMTEVIALANEKKAALEVTWQETQALADTMETRDLSKVSDIVGLYQLLSQGFKTPLTAISRFSAIKGNNVLVSSIDWQLYESVASRKEKKDPSVVVTFNVELYNSGTSFEELFQNFDNLIQRVKEGFTGYKIEYSELPARLALDKKNKVIPIQIKITGTDL